MASWIPNSNSF